MIDPRDRPEKAACDWLRLSRIVGAMQIKPAFDAWLARKRRYDRDPEVRENASLR